MSAIHAKRAAALKSAQDLIASVQAAGGRDLTDAEAAQVDALFTEVKGYDEAIARVGNQKSLIQEIADMSGPQGGEPGAGNQYLDLSGVGRKALAAKIADGMANPHTKALAVSGDVTEPLGLTTADPIAQGRIPSSLLDVLTVNRHDSAAFGYLRQASRNNLAAPVADGAVKPTSVYGLTRIEDKLQVIAHLSEAVPEYWLADNKSIQGFVANELLYGLNRAVENQVINGNGTSPQIRGLLATSGIQTVAAVVDTGVLQRLETIRAGINAVEALGYNPGVVVLHPSEWNMVEGLRDADGRYMLDNGAGDRAARKLFGVQVVTTPSIATTAGLVLDLATVALDTDKIGIRTQWGQVSDDFSRNQIRARVEGRFGLSVYQPEAVAKLTLTA